MFPLRAARLFGFVLALLASAHLSYASTLRVAWDPNSEPDIAGYVVYWGTQSGAYASRLDVGSQTTVDVTGLADGTTYYFVVTAYNTAGMTSQPSAEVSGQTPAPVAPSTTLGPSITCPVATGSSADGNPVVVNFPPPTVVGGAPPVTTSCSPASGSRFPVGSTTFTCTAVDVLHQSASCSSVVLVYGPPPPPAITCPTPTATSLDGNPVVVTFSPAVTGGATPVGSACTPPSGSLFPVGSTALTCTAVDALQRVASCQSSVSVSSSTSTTLKRRGRKWR